MRNRLRSERGQDLVEFALILPLLLMITFGLIDFGVAVFSYNTIGNAAREGARYGIVHPHDTPGVQNAALQFASGLALGAGNVQVNWTPLAVSVQVDYAAPLISGVILQWVGVGPTIPFRAVAAMQREQ